MGSVYHGDGLLSFCYPFRELPHSKEPPPVPYDERAGRLDFSLWLYSSASSPAGTNRKSQHRHRSQWEIQQAHPQANACCRQ